jgi:hypothetical protein
MAGPNKFTKPALTLQEMINRNHKSGIDILASIKPTDSPEEKEDKIARGNALITEASQLREKSKDPVFREEYHEKQRAAKPSNDSLKERVRSQEELDVEKRAQELSSGLGDLASKVWSGAKKAAGAVGSGINNAMSASGAVQLGLPISQSKAPQEPPEEAPAVATAERPPAAPTEVPAPAPTSLVSKVNTATVEKATTPAPEVTAAPDPTPTADAPTRPDYDKEHEKYNEEYKKERQTLENREAIEAIANALGRIGAGFYGSKTGVDMSTTEFKTQDWDKKRQMAQGDRQVSLADLQNRRVSQVQQDQFAASEARSRSEFGQKMELETKKLTVEEQIATETRKSREVSQSIANHLKQDKMDADARKERDRRMDADKKNASDAILKISTHKDLSDEEKERAYGTILQRFDVPAHLIEPAINKTKAWLGLPFIQVKDKDASLRAVNEMVNEVISRKYMQASIKQGYMNPEDSEDFLANGPLDAAASLYQDMFPHISAEDALATVKKRRAERAGSK